MLQAVKVIAYTLLDACLLFLLFLNMGEKTCFFLKREIRRMFSKQVKSGTLNTDSRQSEVNRQNSWG